MLLLAVSVAVLAGCAAAPVPPERFFRLHDPAEVARAPATLAGQLVVQAPRVEGLYNERAVIYSRGPDHRELRQYHYKYWVAPPAQLVQDYLVAYLRRGASASRVVREFGDGYTDHLVTGRLLGFERRVDDERRAVVVDMELAVTPPGKQRPAFIRRYNETTGVGGGTMADTVKAFERALHAIASDFAADLAVLVRAGAEKNE
ncbi:MAG: ABC-type transport auxiliary lipoprotein family protein [Gammaproteobacteria bacterium]|nr:ABC-type transport auxiliary lipoprotein family protein [Gammaproteobacteria bacterium]